jgi:MSHA biogenesis protein MshP
VKCRAAESGFGLVSALFLLVVLSSAAAFMVNLTGIERTTVNFAIQGAHAYQAARSGVEWGIWQLENNGTCFADTDLNLTESGLTGFTVSMTCTDNGQDHTEATTTSTVYQIVATSQIRAYGDRDYARRRLQVTISDAP